MRFLLAAVALSCLALCGSPVAAAKGARITGIYSDLRYIEEAGDLLGTEIRISRSHGRYNASVQVAEGAPGEVITVPVKVDGDKVSFTLTDKDYRYLYVGTIASSGFSGIRTVATPKQQVTSPFRLARKRHSYWKTQTIRSGCDGDPNPRIRIRT
jgi:hypothetical protein